MNIVIVLLLLLTPQMALSLDFETLFMPGDVIKGHQKYETNCKECHVQNRDLTQKRLCLDCHEKVNDDLNNQRGFHYKNKQANTSDCKSCHTEHKGRLKDIVNFDRDQFNHDQTDYKLTGQHKKTLCSDCHQAEKKYREAPQLCINCHKKKDVHKKKLGKKCQDCHNTSSWDAKTFDHDKTDFKLKGAHKEANCSLCHTNKLFNDTPKTCISCHKIKDVHNKKMGTKCASCHTPKKWSKVTFNHKKDTLYELKGAHKNVKCLTCHKKIKHPNKKLKKPRSCYTCHKSSDVHKGKSGKKCQDCHTTSSWLKTDFDHNKTDFKLKGKHKKVSCQSCHQNDIKGKKTKSRCIDCHQADDAHDTQQGKTCVRCHNEQSWLLDDVQYDHDFSSFPLIGQHSAVSCDSCHLDALFKDTKKTCIDCHALDDVHKKTLGTQCRDCHNPNDWLIWSFEHDEEDYALDGVHQKLHCDSCHKKPLSKENKLLSTCVSCHKSDDVHDGNFGAQCQNCHSQDNFQALDIQSMSTFQRFNK